MLSCLRMQVARGVSLHHGRVHCLPSRVVRTTTVQEAPTPVHHNTLLTESQSTLLSNCVLWTGEEDPVTGKPRKPFAGSALLRGNRVEAVLEAGTTLPAVDQVMDCGGWALLPGMVGTQREQVEQLQSHFGYSAEESLVCATRTGGLMAGLQVGQIKPGWLADLLLVEGRPWEDSSALMSARSPFQATASPGI